MFPHKKGCSCEACETTLVREVEEVLGWPPMSAEAVERVLLEAAGYAETDRRFWADELWPLIACVEGARRDGEVNGYAEDELRTVLMLRRMRGS